MESPVGIHHRKAAGIAAGLVLLTLATFAGTARNGFVDFDDGEYVYENPEVRAGLTWSGLAWAFTTTRAANWHPLTWISHLTDVELFGLAPAGHHATSVVLHAATVATLFFALLGLGGALGRSAAVAALFAVHPLRVESVAWVAERKDVLSLFFVMLAIAAYARYARSGRLRDYALVAAAHAASLMSKPTAVTLPFLLLLLDIWPLGRWNVLSTGSWGGEESRRRLLEKLPLLALSAVSSAVTYLAQAGESATVRLEDIALGQRLANALVACAGYLAKTVWPARLAVFYPHPASVGDRVPPSAIAVAVVVLAALSGFALAQARRRPFVIVGWLWFIGALVPMIGLVQVGSQGMADRYTYLPSIGLLLAAVWGVAEAGRGTRISPAVIAGVTALLIVALAVTSWRQVTHWRDNRALYEHALGVTDKNWLAWNNLGVHYLASGEPARALGMFVTSRSIKPGYAIAWYNSGVALSGLRHLDEALACYQEAARLDPTDQRTPVNLGMTLIELNRPAEAVGWLERALALDPDNSLALFDLALAYARLGDRARSEAYRDRLRQVDPANAPALERWLRP